jgi:hypothetical protein
MIEICYLPFLLKFIQISIITFRGEEMKNRKCSNCDEIGHDRRSCPNPIVVKSKKPPSNVWKELEWEEHLDAMELVCKNPDGMTLEEVGDIIGVTRERVRQIEVVAIRKLLTGVGLGDFIDTGRYAIPLTECTECETLFVRDGSEYLCDDCRPDIIPEMIPVRSSVYIGSQHVARTNPKKKRSHIDKNVDVDVHIAFAGLFELFED